MKQFKLEPAIERLISATNSGDGESLLQSFTEDAVLVDFGRTFRGRSQIAVWDRQENTGTQNVIRVNDVVQGAPVRLKISVRQSITNISYVKQPQKQLAAFTSRRRTPQTPSTILFHE